MFYVFIKYAKLWELTHVRDKRGSENPTPKEPK